MAQLREWLEARGLGRYADALLAQDIELDILPQLTDADLTARSDDVHSQEQSGLRGCGHQYAKEANVKLIYQQSVARNAHADAAA